MKVALRQALQARETGDRDPSGRAGTLLRIRHELGQVLEQAPLGPTPVGETACRALMAAALDAAAQEITEEDRPA